MRTNQATPVLTTYGNVVKANTLLYYYPPGYGPLPLSSNVTTSRLLFPIPDREVVLNPLLK